MPNAVKKSWYNQQDLNGSKLVNVDVGLELDIEVLDQFLVGLAIHLVECHLLTPNELLKNDEFKMRHVENRRVLG